MTYIQALIMGALQGVTELFPVSSLGHSVIIPALLGWKLDENAPFFLVFLVATHLATSLVLLGFYFQDWIRIVAGLSRSLKNRYIDPADTYARLGWLIVVATIPAGILGVLFQDKLQALFATPIAAAIFLAMNGCLLYGAELIRRKRTSTTSIHSDEQISRLPWARSVWIGCAQALALLPGFSRTGATLGGGLAAGLDHPNAARFAFLLATPIIFAAAVLKLPELFISGNAFPIGEILAGAVAAAVGAFCSVKFLTRYFETKTLRPFAIYCFAAGLLSVILLVSLHR